MRGYVPGQKSSAVARGIRPSVAVDLAFERGFYEGDYTVIGDPNVPFRPEMERVRRAAETKWHDRIAAFDEIVEWTDRDAPDVRTGNVTMSGSPLSAQKRAVLLINNGVFERQW